MGYSTQARMARDADLISRVAACAATQGVAEPERWAWDRQWKIAAQTGLHNAYQNAINANPNPPTNTPGPGANETAVPDTEILKAVQAVLAAEKPATP